MNSPETVEKMMSGMDRHFRNYKRPKRQKMILRNKLGVKTHASHSN